MKKLSAAFLLAGLFFGGVLVYADQADVIPILSLDLDNRNMVITPPGTQEQWLVHFKSGCVGLKPDSKEITLVTTGDLNTDRDFFKVGYLDRCTIDQAEEINARFKIDSFYPSGDESVLSSMDGKKRFSVQHTACAIPSFIHQSLYAFLGDTRMPQDGDELYLPRNAGSCKIRFSKALIPSTIKPPSAPTSSSGSYSQPGTISDLKATPTDEGVELSWKKARDDENVDYYWVGVETSRLNVKNLTVDDLSDRRKATTNYYKVTELDNEHTYYFYVIAVDKNAHPAPLWSNAAVVAPKGSALRPVLEVPQGNTTLNFHLREETDQTFFFDWDLIPRATRYFVALEVNGRRDFILQGVRKTVYVNKTLARKGKDLRLIIRAFNRYGILDEVYYTFKF